MLTSLGRPTLLLAPLRAQRPWASLGPEHTEVSLGAQHPQVSLRAEHTWALLDPRHTRASLRAILAGCTVLLGSRPAVDSPLFAIRGGVGLQAAPGVWPWVHRFVWLSSPTPGCLQSLVGEDALPDLLPPALFFCFNSCLGRGHGSFSPRSHVLHRVQPQDTSLRSKTAE